jgi:L-seryl-tRNA(Ser) seleniumtransferase
MSLNPLRNIPSVNDLLEYPRLRKLVDRISPGVVVSGVRAVLEEVRSEVQTAASEMTLPSLSELADRIARRVLETAHPGQIPVINATGVLLASHLGSPPLAAEAIAEMTTVAGEFASIELDLSTGQPARRGQAVETLLAELSGAEAALITSTRAGAAVLAVAALAAGREVIVSRGHLVAFAAGCRLAELIAAGGATLREVGATNLTRLDDYQRAIGERTAAMMLVHPSRSAVVGFSESVSLEQLVELARRREIPVVHDIGLGGLVKLDGIGPADQSTAAGSLQAGADVVILAGDQLLGGPASGIVLGSRSLIRSMSGHPMAEAFAADKLTLAALGATLRLWREPEKARRSIPLIGLLGTSVENLKNRAERLAPQLAETAAVARAKASPATSCLAGIPVASHQIPTWQIAVEPAGVTAERLAAALRLGSPPVVAVAEADRVLLDLRSVIPRQDMMLVEAFAGLASHP